MNYSLFAVFVIGLVASFSTCAAVVSGLLVAVSASAPNRLRPHVFFHIGRLGGFAVLGALIGWVGSVFTLSTYANGILILAISVLMIALGARLLNMVPAWCAISMPTSLAHRIHKLTDSKHPFIPMILGVATFFLPCGFTQSMQLYALSTGSPVRAALIMFVFALGTTPALFSIGALTAFAKGKTLKGVTMVAGVLVIVLGVWNISNAMTLLGWNWPTASSGTSPSPLLKGEAASDEQIVTMEVTSAGTYEPDVLTVKAGVPVKWEIAGSDFMGCASTLVMPKLKMRKSLSSGLTEIDLPALDAGTYPFSCSMGMVRGTMIVE